MEQLLLTAYLPVLMLLAGAGVLQAYRLLRPGLAALFVRIFTTLLLAAAGAGEVLIVHGLTAPKAPHGGILPMQWGVLDGIGFWYTMGALALGCVVMWCRPTQERSGSVEAYTGVLVLLSTAWLAALARTTQTGVAVALLAVVAVTMMAALLHEKSYEDVAAAVGRMGSDLAVAMALLILGMSGCVLTSGTADLALLGGASHLAPLAIVSWGMMLAGLSWFFQMHPFGGWRFQMPWRTESTAVALVTGSGVLAGTLMLFRLAVPLAGTVATAVMCEVGALLLVNGCAVALRSLRHDSLLRLGEGTGTMAVALMVGTTAFAGASHEAAAGITVAMLAALGGGVLLPFTVLLLRTAAQESGSDLSGDSLHAGLGGSRWHAALFGVSLAACAGLPPFPVFFLGMMGILDGVGTPYAWCAGALLFVWCTGMGASWVVLHALARAEGGRKAGAHTARMPQIAGGMVCAAVFGVMVTAGLIGRIVDTLTVVLR